MAYYTHPDIESGKLIEAQDIHEMDEQIYENTQELTSQYGKISKLESSSEQNANVHMGFFRDAQGYLCEI